jgi:riboflavin transporter FmnP
VVGNRVSDQSVIGFRAAYKGRPVVKRIVVAILLVFVAWTGLGIILHGFVIGPRYDIPGLFRPEPQMIMWLGLLVNAVQAGVFVLTYAWLVRPKSVTAGLTMGILWGLASGVSMGFGSYSAMPIPLFMAVVWCLGTLIIDAVAGLLTGLIVRKDFRHPGSAAQSLEKN